MRGTDRSLAQRPRRSFCVEVMSTTTARQIVWAAVCWLTLIVGAQADPKVAYLESGEGFRVGVKIRILDLADGSVTQFTNDWLNEGSPSWGPGGETLVANGRRDDTKDIFRVRIGGKRTWLTNHPAWDAVPAWSPDGGRIAFSSTRDGDQQIYVMDADGGNVRRVTDDPFAASSPAWSPDGHSLVYTYSDLASFRALRVVDIATGVGRRLTNENGERYSPEWSWDGKHIAYATWDDALNERHVEVTTVDRKDVWRVAKGSGPAWTPDGDISFSGSQGFNHSNIALTGLHGGEVRFLTDGPTAKSALAWYNPRYFAVRTLSLLQPTVWGWLKAR